VCTVGRVASKAVKGVSADLLAYYNNITKAILGSDVQLMKVRTHFQVCFPTMLISNHDLILCLWK